LKKYIGSIIMLFFSLGIFALALIISMRNNNFMILKREGFFHRVFLACILTIVAGLFFDLLLKLRKTRRTFLKTSMLYWGFVALLSRIQIIIGMNYSFSLSFLFSMVIGLIAIFGLGSVFGFFFSRIYMSVYKRLSKSQ